MWDMPGLQSEYKSFSIISPADMIITHEVAVVLAIDKSLMSMATLVAAKRNC